MELEDKTIECCDCGQEFVHSADDQQRYAERGFTHEPKRCRECREKRKAQSGDRRGTQRRGRDRPPRESYEVTCAECGAQTTVPFKPAEDRPVYCRDCYQAKQRAARDQ
ncbi:MAG: zinc-ribbon domain containing protein [Phycisphaerae bacterium]|nr:zinc-ribbon domain containing protein [Phycisphaerae bacterium]